MHQGESPLLSSLLGLIDGYQLDLAPEIRTYELLEKKIGIQAARDLILSRYSKPFLYSLKRADPSYLENYKRVLSVVQFCEQQEAVEI